MKKILVTGGAGFIGSHLTEALINRGDHVIAVDDQSTGNIDNLDDVKDSNQLTWIPGSIADQQLVRDVISDVDQVYHMAAAVGVALIAKEPIQTIERNIEPTAFLLSELDRKHRAGKSIPFFLASTSEVYGKNPKETWAETDDLVFGSTQRARWSYGASKAIDEFLALGYWRQSKFPCVIGRFFNVVGPRQTGAYGMVLPRFVESALENQPLKVHDDGQQVRCFAHVNDIIKAITSLMDSPDACGNIYNIGSDHPVSILDLARRVVALASSNSEIEFQSYSNAYDKDFEDIRRRVPDLTKLTAAIGYKPNYGLDEIITEVIKSKRLDI